MRACQSPPLQASLTIMKGKTGIVILVILCVGLGVGLLVRHSRAVDEEHKAEARIKQLADDVVHTQDQLGEQKKVNDTLEKSLEAKTVEAQSLPNKRDTATATITPPDQDPRH